MREMRKKYFLVPALFLIFLIALFFWKSQNNRNRQEVNTRNVTPATSAAASQQFKPAPLTIDQIFNINRSWVATLSAEKVRVLITTGDVIPARSVNFKAVQNKNFAWPFEKTADVLRNSDLTFINFETPLIPDCPLTNEGMKFCGDQRNLEGLLTAGVDVVSLANNHAGNYGEFGVEKTTDLLTQAGIFTTGTSGVVFKNIRGLDFAFLGYNDIESSESGISWADNKKVAAQIKETKGKDSVVIITFHWGTEYTSQPTARQKELAHLAIDSGADLVIGNHPHWIQPVEIYKEKLITYSHGNFIFDQMWSQKTREGIVGRYTFYEDQLIDAEFLPIQIDDFGQPHFLEGQQKNKILEEMKTETQNYSRTNL